MPLKRFFFRTISLLLLGAVIFFGLAPYAQSFRQGAVRPLAVRSETTPPINLEHIFHGEINRRGRPVGYHSRPGGVDPENARVTRITAGPNRLGVYEAVIEVRTKDGKWLEKRSTFFPDRMGRDEVVAAILNAYHNRTTMESNRFTGPSGKGFVIRGYLLSDGAVNTAFPLYGKR